jgi:flagellar capping protein FliD
MTERERVEEVRLFFRLKKKEFAELLGHAYPQNYSNYLKGKSNLSIKMLKSIKEHNSNINTDWILYGEGEMFVSNNDISGGHKIINGDNNHAQIGDNSKSKINSNNSNTTEVEYLKKEIKNLNKLLSSKDQQLEDKEARLRDKERFIALLEKNQK